MDIKVVFGRVLREVRKGKNISQEHLAHEAGLERTYISMLERGINQPSIATLIAIAKVLEVRPGMLVDRVMDEMEK